MVLVICSELIGMKHLLNLLNQDEHASISTICSLVSNNFWKYIEVGDNMCNDQTELSIDNANLISLSVGKSFTSVTSISLSRIFSFPRVYCIMTRG